MTSISPLILSGFESLEPKFRQVIETGRSKCRCRSRIWKREGVGDASIDWPRLASGIGSEWLGLFLPGKGELRAGVRNVQYQHVP